jgi:hypothetical protein
MIARQSTARTYTLGPILDANGVAVTTESVGNLRVSKNGGTPVTLNGGATLTHQYTGHYLLALTASDHDTAGIVEISLDSGANACPVLRIVVVSQTVYDALYASGATGLLPANVVQVAGQTASAAAGVSFPAVIGTSTLDAAGVRLAVGLASANLDTQLSSIPTAAVIASEVDTVLTAAHGSGSWQTGTGGGTDWTADERAAIRTILGVPLSGTTPVMPTEGVLDAIRDQVLPLTYTVPNRVDASATVTVGPETVDEIAEGVVGRLGSATVRLVSPLTPDGGLITILRGDDYHVADRQVYEWTEEAAGWPVLTDASIELRLNEGGPVIAGSVLVDTGSEKKVRVEITRAQSLTAQSGIFRLVAILHPSGREVTLKRGKVITLW